MKQWKEGSPTENSKVALVHFLYQVPLIRTHVPIGVIDGHDPPGLIDEIVPSLAAVVDEIVVGFKHAVGEPVCAGRRCHAKAAVRPIS